MSCLFNCVNSTVLSIVDVAMLPTYICCLLSSYRLQSGIILHILGAELTQAKIDESVVGTDDDKYCIYKVEEEKQPEHQVNKFSNSSPMFRMTTRWHKHSHKMEYFF